MRSLARALVTAALLVGAGTARAGDDTPPATGADATASGSGSDDEIPPGAEVVEIFDERPEKPFDRDTDVRLTGEELAARGATDLATALALIPDVEVRDAGRGGFNLDIRGARKQAVRLLLDGVDVNDPYYGMFDVSTIPITDIVQIRVSTAPASPIDGPGGSGGVIEVHTRDAYGARLTVARLTSDSMPTFGASATGRTPLAPDLAVRLSATANFGSAQFDTATPGTFVANDLKATTGAMRLEYRHGDRRIAIDGYVDDRRFVSPPSDELSTALVTAIDGETTGRASIAYDDDLGADEKMQIQARAWADAVTMTSRNFSDYALERIANTEQLFTMRTGAMALLTRPIGKIARWVASVTVDRDQARDELTTSGGGETLATGATTIVEAAGDGQLEKGAWKLDGSAGVAVPVAVSGAPAWPEAKLSAKYAATSKLDVEAILARKGNVPTLRDRFAGTAANTALGPELADHAELRVTAHPRDGVEAWVAPYWRHTTNTVMLDPNGSGLLINAGDIRVKGVDALARARLDRWLELGGAYDYAFANSDTLGPDPLPRFPHHRGEGWVRGYLDPQASAMFRTRYVGSAIDSGGVTPAYVVSDATLTYSPSARWLAVLHCEDVFDRRPETRFGYHTVGRVVSLALQGTWD